MIGLKDKPSGRLSHLNERQLQEYRELRRKLNSAKSVKEAEGIYNKIISLIKIAG